MTAKIRRTRVLVMALTFAAALPAPRAAAQALSRDRGPAAPAGSAVGPPAFGVEASPAFKSAVLSSVEKSFLRATGSDVECSNRDKILHFLRTLTNVTFTGEQYDAKVKETLAGVEIIFVKNSVRDSGMLPGIPGGAKGYAIAAKHMKAAEKLCKCRIAGAGKAALVFFTNTGDETGYEVSPPRKVADLGRHEAMHVFLPALGDGKLDSTSYHHGLTQSLGWGDAQAGTYVRYNPKRACMP